MTSAENSRPVPLEVGDVPVGAVGDRAGPAVGTPLTILYRGPLASCDYDCPYCPFAKRRDTPEQLRADRAALERFVAWVGDQPERISVLFTPWGEALVRSWYRDAIRDLSRMPNVERVAVQTNISSRLAWLSDCDLSKVALWCTYHPGQVAYERFLDKTHALIAADVRFSVGIVGQAEHLDDARRLRRDLPSEIYLWVNAAEGRTYDDAEADEWAAIDPLFPVSRFPHAARGKACHTGETAISVNGDGDVRRCHFVSARLGNLYDGSFRDALKPRPCPLDVCDCHIGYVHMPELGLYETFAGGVLERIPALWPDPELRDIGAATPAERLSTPCRHGSARS